MRWLIIKCIGFIAFTAYIQGIILPWAISNNRMPIWADILLIVIILTGWVFVLECVAIKLISKLQDDKKQR